MRSPHPCRKQLTIAHSALPYTWSQELGEVDVAVPVPAGSKSRDLSVTIAKKKLSVALKGKEPIMSGELCKDIKVDDSTWTLRTVPLTHSAHVLNPVQKIIRLFISILRKSTIRLGGRTFSPIIRRSTPPRSSQRIAS